jgi:peptidoglycan/xylan/chitin deacetylase (PgdA/CDA1 family)
LAVADAALISRPKELMMLRYRAIAVVAMLILLLGSIPVANAGKPRPTPTPSPTPTPGPSVVYVTLGFDDGNVDQYAVRSILSAHNMHATFYISSGLTGDPDHLTWEQLAGVYADGNEIGGHSLTHTRLTRLADAALRQEVCGDRVNLFANGFQPTSFAYPFGSYNSTTIQALKDCGYNSGRTVAMGPDTIPPHDPYATEAMTLVKSSTSLATIQGWITQAEQSGGGWVQLIFHHVCDNCNVYSITLGDLTALLDWLAPRSANGTTVKTVHEVLGGAVQPPVAP